MAHPENKNYQEEFQVPKLNDQLSNLDTRIQEMEEKLLFLKDDQARFTEGKGIVIHPPHAREISAITEQISSLRSLKRDINKRKDSLTESTKIVLSAEIGEAIALTNAEKHSDATNDLGLLRHDIWKKMDTLEKGGRKSVRDLVENSIKFDFYPNNTTTERIYDIITEAFLNTKSREWISDFTEKKFKKVGLDISKDEFISNVFSEAYLNMNRTMLDTLLGNTMHVTLNGKQEFFGTDPYLPKIYDESYDKIIRKGLDILDGDNKGHISPEKEEVVKIASLGYSMSDIGFAEEEITENSASGEAEKEASEVYEDNEVFDKNQLIPEAADFIMYFEDYSNVPYWDYGQWSWGYGTKVPGSTNDENKNPGGTINKEEAKVLKYAHIEADYKKVNQYFWFEPMTKNQKIAILSFVYNNGRDIFEVTKGARNLQKVFFDPKSSIDEKIKAMMPFHYASGTPLEGLKRRRAGEAILARKKEEGNREQIDMMVMVDNEKPGETTSRIYGKETLGRTVMRAMDRIDKKSTSSDSKILASNLAHLNPNFNVIHDGDLIFTKKKKYKDTEYFEVRLQRKNPELRGEDISFIVRGNETYDIDTPLEDVHSDKLREIHDQEAAKIESKVPPNYTVGNKDTLGKILEQLLPNIYNDSNPGWKTTVNYSPNPGDKLFINGTTLIVERGTQEFIFEVK